MLRIGYKPSSEQLGPTALVRQAVRADAAGFHFTLISDHFHPWPDYEADVLPRLRQLRPRRDQLGRRRAE